MYLSIFLSVSPNKVIESKMTWDFLQVEQQNGGGTSVEGFPIRKRWKHQRKNPELQRSSETTGKPVYLQEMNEIISHLSLVSQWT